MDLDARSLAQAIVETIRDPLLVLDQHLCVVDWWNHGAAMNATGR